MRGSKSTRACAPVEYARWGGGCWISTNDFVGVKHLQGGDQEGIGVACRRTCAATLFGGCWSLASMCWRCELVSVQGMFQGHVCGAREASAKLFMGV